MTENKNYTSDWIHDLEGRNHWNLYWHQLNLVLNKATPNSSDRITEVGIGSGLTSSYLRQKGYHVTTFDIDKNKHPDVVGDVIQDPLPKGDILMAFEIFEHIPLSDAKKVWKKAYEQDFKNIAFSLPHAYKTYLWSDIWIPFKKWTHFHIGRKRKKILQKHHHWELGIDGITTKDVTNWVNDAGFTIPVTYRYRNHQFFLAKRKDLK